MDPLQIGAALLVIAAVAGGVVWLQRSDVAAATRRREAMMKRIGFDPALVSLDNPKTRTAGQVVRRRCGKCRQVDLCERWLAGEVGGSTAFCPNAQAFRNLTDANLSAKPNEKAA